MIDEEFCEKHKKRKYYHPERLIWLCSECEYNKVFKNIKGVRDTDTKNIEYQVTEFVREINSSNNTDYLEDLKSKVRKGKLSRVNRAYLINEINYRIYERRST